jgi:hypothetical protein
MGLGYRSFVPSRQNSPDRNAIYLKEGQSYLFQIIIK